MSIGDNLAKQALPWLDGEVPCYAGFGRAVPLVLSMLFW